MKAVVYKEPYTVAVEEVEDSKIEDPTDVVIKITSSAICGSDLHMYEGRTGATPGIVFGHENMGIVEEVRCGRRQDQEGRPDRPAVQRRLRFMPQLPGEQDRLLLDREPGVRRRRVRLCVDGPVQRRAGGVPAGAVRRLQRAGAARGQGARGRLRHAGRRLPDRLSRHRTGDLNPGEMIVVFGAGPVGLMAALSAKIRGASKILVVDKVKSRLKLALR